MTDGIQSAADSMSAEIKHSVVVGRTSYERITYRNFTLHTSGGSGGGRRREGKLFLQLVSDCDP